MIARLRYRGAHRTFRPGAWPVRPAHDPWIAHGFVLDRFSAVRWPN